VRAPLNRRISLLRPVRIEEPGGGATLSFVEEAVAWGRVEARANREDDALQAVRVATRYAATVRFRGDVEPGWRAGWGGRVRRITAAFDPDGRRAFLTLICEDEE